PASRGRGGGGGRGARLRAGALRPHRLDARRRAAGLGVGGGRAGTADLAPPRTAARVLVRDRAHGRRPAGRRRGPGRAARAAARYRPAQHVWPAAALTVLSGYDGRLDPGKLWAPLVAVSAVTAATALVGINQRTRQAYLTALQERARRLELDRDRQARLAVA